MIVFTDTLVANVGVGEKVIPRASHIILDSELTCICSVHSSDAVIVYNDASENSYADLGRVRVPSFTPPPRYEDFDPDW
jgi:hypothetical protein